MTLLTTARRACIVASATLALCAAAPSMAATIDFSSGTYDLTGPNQVYKEQCYSFATRVGGHFDSNTSPANPIVPGVPYLVFHESANNLVNNLITLTFGGAAFDFLDFDLIYDTPILTFNPNINPPMTVLGSGGQSLITPFAGSPGFIGTVSAGFTNVTSVTFDINLNSTSAGNVLLDNVVV